MKISIQEEGKEEKQVFLTFKEAAEANGIQSPQIYLILKRTNPRYKRRSDGKAVFIQEEKDEKLCSIDNEDFTSFGQIKERFGISPTVFLNQISRKKRHFLEKDEITHFVEDPSPEMEKIIDGQKRMEMDQKISAKCKNCNVKQLSYDVLTKRKVAFPINKGKNFKYDADLMEISQKSLSSQSKKISRPAKGHYLYQPEENHQQNPGMGTPGLERKS